MPPRILPAHPKRVLGFYPHRRVTGRTALEGPRLVPRSFASLDMRHPHADRDAHLEFLVGRSVERYRPSLVAIAIVDRSPEELTLGRWVERVVRHFGIDCVFVDVTYAATVLGHRDIDARSSDKVAQVVARHVPDLRSRVLSAGSVAAFNLRRRRSYAWKAALAALAVSGVADLDDCCFEPKSI